MRIQAAMLAILLGGAGALGCAETTRVETTSRTSTTPAGEPVIIQEEKTVTKSDTDSCNGILSCTVDFAGTVIAFPFRLIGSVFGAIF